TSGNRPAPGGADGCGRGRIAWPGTGRPPAGGERLVRDRAAVGGERSVRKRAACGNRAAVGGGRSVRNGAAPGDGPATARRRPGGAAAGRRPGGSGRRERWCDAPLGKRRKTKANPNPQPKLKPKPEPKPALKLNPKPKPKPGPKPPAPAALVKRRNRWVFRVADPSRRRIVVVKRYDDWRDAVSERDVMRSYGKARHLVRMYRWRKRDGRGYIIMEYVRGSTLNEVIARRGALPPAKVRALALSVLDGLHQLHRRGFVHGDLHGRNVIVTDYDKAKVKIIDLQHAVKLGPSGRGRAKRIVPDPPPWLPPESRDGWLTPGYDIYGVGFMCACMLAGRILRTEAELRGVVAAGRASPPASPRTSGPASPRTSGPSSPRTSGPASPRASSPASPHDAPTAERLWQVVDKALQPNPGRRYADARAMMEDL